MYHTNKKTYLNNSEIKLTAWLIGIETKRMGKAFIALNKMSDPSAYNE